MDGKIRATILEDWKGLLTFRKPLTERTTQSNDAFVSNCPPFCLALQGITYTFVAGASAAGGSPFR